MTRIVMNAFLIALLVSLMAGCSTAPKTMQGRENLEFDAQAALQRARRQDATIDEQLQSAQGYAVFPTVGKGAVWVGGAYGRGVLYQGSGIVGFCDITQASIGLQIGGQSYTEIIAFKTAEALTNFKEGHFEFDAQATAVALTAGAGANAHYNHGVAVFTMNEAGLMYEASIGGQKFSYQDK